MSISIHGGPQSFQIWHHASEMDDAQSGAGDQSSSIQQLIQLLESMLAQQSGTQDQPQAGSQVQAALQDGSNVQGANAGCQGTSGDQLSGKEQSQLESLINQLKDNGGSDHLTHHEKQEIKKLISELEQQQGSQSQGQGNSTQVSQDLSTLEAMLNGQSTNASYVTP
jgi:hypothetical protein